MKTILWCFDTPAERSAFIRGLDFVNDSAISYELVGDTDVKTHDKDYGTDIQQDD